MEAEVTAAGGGRASVSGGGGSTGHANEAEALLLLELFKLNKSNELWDFCGPGPGGRGNTFGQKMGGGEAGGWCGAPAVLSWAGLASCNNGLAPTTIVLSSYPATCSRLHPTWGQTIEGRRVEVCKVREVVAGAADGRGHGVAGHGGHVRQLGGHVRHVGGGAVGGRGRGVLGPADHVRARGPADDAARVHTRLQRGAWTRGT